MQYLGPARYTHNLTGLRAPYFFLENNTRPRLYLRLNLCPKLRASQLETKAGGDRGTRSGHQRALHNASKDNA